MNDNTLGETNNLEGRDGNTGANKPAIGMSPYATGGGGVTFERKVAVRYLAHLLVGDSAVEFGEGRSAVSVAFQQSPLHLVDDLVVCTAGSEESEPSWEIALEVRRSPNLVLSDERTQRLFDKLIGDLINVPADGMERRLGLVVSGRRPHAEQLAKLTGLAATQMDAPGFFDLVRTPNRFDAGVRDRLDHVRGLVERSLKDIDQSDPTTAMVQQRTWHLLSRLFVLMPRLETPDETDWATVANNLIAVARGTDLAGASRLRDRLLALASEYPQKSARIDLTLLRRDAYDVLDPDIRRHRDGWRVLDHLHQSALKSVRNEIASMDGVLRASLDRSEAVIELVAAAKDADALLVSGESGVGKSSLTLRSLTSACAVSSKGAQALCINLRHIPKLTVDFERKLGCSLSTLLNELSAPHRMLIVDGADAVVEGMEVAFRYVVDAAVESGIKVVAVAAEDSMGMVRDILADRFGSGLVEYAVKPLTNIELEEIVTTFPELKGLYSDLRSREIMRRLIVVDLLVRGKPAGIPLTDADAMHEVWTGLVRRRERSDRGHPDARQTVLLQLADLSLHGGDRLDVISKLDSTAIAGLRQDGLLHSPPENPFSIGSEFAHDELRRYAVARLLLAEGDPTSKLLSAGAPRWALGAAMLACQAWLQQPDRVATPLKGRFCALQASFDALGEAGFGTRWGDVPGEALVTLVDPSAVLKDAWALLRADDATGLRRLARLVNQRLRDENGLVKVVAVEPIVERLLDDKTPWLSGEYASELLREWLRVHAVACTPAGHPLRILLRERLVDSCAEADRRLAEQREAAAVARATRSPEDVERERRLVESYPSLMPETGLFDRSSRRSDDVPRECKDEDFLELLALLGPDLGDRGEAILRRVALDAPSWLAPAVEEPFTGLALANCRTSLLAELTQAYYLDDEAGYSAFYDDGIRGHQVRTGGFYSPLNAWYLGPFKALFQSDFRGGIAVLNRLLNHAALMRARKLADLYGMGDDAENVKFDPYRAELNIDGTPRLYVGDEHVWKWYRGTGVGPYPCMSALQALERACDQLIQVGAPIENVVSALLEGCENLAMVSLIVGILVRNLEVGDDLLDRYLTEPLIWTHEFSRIAEEYGPLADSSSDIKGSDRRKWSLRDAAAFLTFRATGERVDDLRKMGNTLVEKARDLVEREHIAEGIEGERKGDEDIELWLAQVRGWASNLDRDRLRIFEGPDGLYVQTMPEDEVVRALQPSNEDLARAAEVMRLTGRYFPKPDQAFNDLIEPDELNSDIVSARMLLETPPSLSAQHPWDIPALVAAATLEAHLLRRASFPDDALTFAVDTVVRVSEGEASPSPYEFEGTYFERGADRSAARVIPLLLMRAAAGLRAIVDGDARSLVFSRVYAGGLNVARAVADEVRLHMARGMDHLWATPCSRNETCHHIVGRQLAAETMRNCTVGDWSPATGVRSVIALEEPLTKSLANTPDDSILPNRLDASIRALAPAAMANICVSTAARDLLSTLLDAQRRSLLYHEHKDVDPRGAHTLVSARALLTLAREGNDREIYNHIDAYAGSSELVTKLLRALSAAAEETPDRAATARRIWPDVIRHTLGLNVDGRATSRGAFRKEAAIAALIPNAAPENRYLYRELRGKPIAWWEPIALRSEVETWLAVAAGDANCVDQLIGFLEVLAPEDQARIGFPWVAELALANPGNVAKGSWLLPTWLIDTRSDVADAGLSDKWQHVVDALVVEGVTQLARYSV